MNKSSATTTSRATPEEEGDVRPPAWHAAACLFGVVGSIGLTSWAVVSDYDPGTVVGAVLALLFAYGTVDAATTRLWMSRGRVVMRDRVIRIRSVQVGEIRSITYLPDELFYLETDGGRRVQFPAASRDLQRFAQMLCERVGAVRPVHLRGDLQALEAGRLDET